MNCHEIDKNEVIDRYLSGGLSEAEQHIFEDHYFGCEDCFEHLRIARALQAKPKSRQSRSWTLYPSPGRWRSVLLPIAALAAVALLITIYWNWPTSKVSPFQQDTENVAGRSPVEYKPAEERETLISQLARFEPPPYAPARLRETGDGARVQFDQAMSYYRKGDYNAAIKGLQTTARLSPKAVDVNFYLGACYLLTNQPQRATDALEKATSPNSPVFAEQAHYYLAKTYLQEHNLASARRELESTLTFHGAREDEARRLIQELDKIQ